MTIVIQKSRNQYLLVMRERNGREYFNRNFDLFNTYEEALAEAQYRKAHDKKIKNIFKNL